MLRRLILAVAAGASIWLSFPDAGIWPAAPLGVALLTAAVLGAGVGAGAFLGFVAGLAWFVPYVSWTGLHVGYLPWLALATLQAVFVAGFGAVVAYLHGGGFRSRRTPTGGATAVGPPRVRPAGVALAWVVLEWARGTIPFGGFPWGRIAFSQADSPLARLAALGGPAAVGFVVALVGALLAALAVGLLRFDSGRTLLLRSAGVLVLVLAPAAVPLPTSGTPATFLVIQGNAPDAGLDFNANRRQILDNHGRVSREAAADVRAGRLARPDLVVWPENAADIDPFVHPDAGAVIDGALAALDAPLLLGAVLSGPGEYVSNTSLLYLPGRGPEQRYVKRRPVPFAEYMPHREFFRAVTNKVDLLERDFAAGGEVGVVRVARAGGGEIAAGIGICFEVAIDDVLRDTIRAGANVLVIQTNNAMFDRSAESAQQLAISRIRAIEYGRSVVHSSNVGISALVTPDGRAHQATQLFTPAVVSGRLPLRTEATLATRLGPWPERAAAAGFLLLLSARGLPGLRRRRR